ncbi:hypothetical protein DL768_001282 [Monosporascus sp. mg162]|nr:hypothetical protein DL768_001282 [Monosporascus sp. mg162]
MTSTESKGFSSDGVGTFVRHDEKLLTSGNFSDVEVRCGDKSWKLHKLILSSRCAWFDKALNGEFMEASSGVVTIDNFEPDKVYPMILFIYTGKSPCPDPDDIQFLPLISLYELGDYFLLPELCEVALAQLKAKLDVAARLLQLTKLDNGKGVGNEYRGPNGSGSGGLFGSANAFGSVSGAGSVNAFGSVNRSGTSSGSGSVNATAEQKTKAAHHCKSFYEAVLYVYTNDILSELEPLRKPLVDFFSKTALYHMDAAAKGVELLTRVPRFTVEILMRGGGLAIDLTHVRYPFSCRQCGNSLSSQAGGLYEKTRLEGGSNNLYVASYCKSCAKNVA